MSKTRHVAHGHFERSFPQSGGSLRVISLDGNYGFCFQVYMNLAIKQLLDVNIQDHSFTANVEVTLHWYGLSSVVKRYEEFYDSFKPCVVFANACALSDATVSMFEGEDVHHEIVLLKNDDGVLTNHTHFSVTANRTLALRQPFVLESYPFDVQVLSIVLQGKATELWGRRFEVELQHPAEHLPGQRANRIDAGADFIDDQSVDELLCFRARDETTGFSHRYEANIVTSRIYMKASLNMILPSLLVIVLSLLSYWVPPCQLHERASVTLTLLLTQTAGMQYIQEKLPPVPRLTTVEVVQVTSWALLASQGMLHMRTSSLCDQLIDGYEGDASQGMMVDDGIHITDPKDQVYPSQALLLDQIGHGVTYFVFVACVMVVAYRLWWQKRTIAMIKRMHTRSCELGNEYSNGSAERGGSELQRAQPVRTGASGKHGGARRIDQRAVHEAAAEAELAQLREDMLALCHQLQVTTWLTSRNPKYDHFHAASARWHRDHIAPWVPRNTGRKPPPRAALIFDCGTGSTKAVICLLDQLGVVHVFAPKDCNLSISLQDMHAAEDAKKRLHADEEQSQLIALVKEIYRELCLDPPNGATSAGAKLPSDLFLERLAEQKIMHEDDVDDLERLDELLRVDLCRDNLIHRCGADVPLVVWKHLVEKLRARVKAVEKNPVYRWMRETEARFLRGDFVTTDEHKALFSETSNMIIERDVIVGVSAWYRKSYGERTHEQCRVLLENIAVEKPRWIIQRLTDLDECWYEARSVQYAWERYQGTTPAARRTSVGAVLGVGASSTQFSSVYKREAGQRKRSSEGSQRELSMLSLRKGSTSRLPATPAQIAADDEVEHAAYDAAMNARSALTPYVLPTGNGKGKQMILRFDAGSRRENALNTAQQYWEISCREDIREWMRDQGLGTQGDGHKKFLYTRPVVCISACYYAARDARICKASDTLPTPPMSALHVRMKFIERIKEIVAQYPDGISIEQVTHANGIAHDDPERAPKEEDAKTVSNLTFIYTFLSEVFHDETEIRFARDWKLPAAEDASGVIEFRTTWSTGWFLDYVRQLGETV